MTTKNGERKILRNENMCGGRGYVIIERLLSEKELNGKCGLYAKVTIEKDCSLGYHEHHGETETYFLLSGSGVYNDNGTNVPATAGDVFFCEDGCGHGLENTGEEPIVFMALIIKG